MPDYFNGRLRIVAIGASARRIGVAEAATEVRGDFILTPNVPAMVTPGDEFIVSVGVFNNSTGSGPIRVSVQLGPGLSLSGPASVDLQIAEKKEGVGEFRVKANAVLGAATLTFTARRGRPKRASKRASACGPPIAFRTHLTLGRVDGATRDGGAHARPVQRAANGRGRDLDAAARLGTGTDGVSRELRVLVHRTARQQGDVAR